MKIADAKALLVGAKVKFINNREMLEALDMGIKSLDNQIPKLPINESWSPAKWTLAKTELPPVPDRSYAGDKYLATIINDQVIAVDYAKRNIRGKEVVRWEWNGKICPWDIIAWMPFPEPYRED